MNSSSRENVGMVQEMLKKRPPPGERCDFCSTSVTPEHSHLIELAARRILCACRPCYIVFEPEGAAQGKYRAVPTRYREITGFAIDDALWDSLQVPIGLVFFFYNSLEKKMVAFYPSPVGATESLLPLDTWDEITARCPELASIKPDIEAILMQRSRESSRTFIVPIDSAYELVGLIRTSWKGFDGGEEARKKVAEYFDKVRLRSQGKVTARVS
ncbi:MAG: DUF5947 family protein [Candidatus Cybelea sp.]